MRFSAIKVLGFFICLTALSEVAIKCCDVPYCRECNADGKCNSCYSGYGVDSSDGSCKPCSENCLECDSDYTTCSYCKENYGFDSSDGSCQPCPENCGSCSNDYTTCSDCKDFYGFDSNGSCLPCPENCGYCQPDHTKCLACKNNYGVDTFDGSCKPCSDDKCDICAEDYQTCLRCNEFSVLKDNQCLPCSDFIENCSTCDGEFNNLFCNKCFEGFENTDDWKSCQKVSLDDKNDDDETEALRLSVTIWMIIGLAMAIRMNLK